MAEATIAQTLVSSSTVTQPGGGSGSTSTNPLARFTVGAAGAPAAGTSTYTKAGLPANGYAVYSNAIADYLTAGVDFSYNANGFTMLLRQFVDGEKFTLIS